MSSQASSRDFRLELELDAKIKDLSLTSRQASSFTFKTWLDFFKSSSWYFSSSWLVAINLISSIQIVSLRRAICSDVACVRHLLYAKSAVYCISTICIDAKSSFDNQMTELTSSSNDLKLFSIVQIDSQYC